MRLDYTSDLWWKNAVIYCLDVETFADSDGDGVGDFRGLIGKVDYLASLGVTCVWVMPFFPSPNRDDGYDISDYYGVDPRLGTLGDFVELVRTGGDRGIRIPVHPLGNPPPRAPRRQPPPRRAPGVPRVGVVARQPRARLVRLARGPGGRARRYRVPGQG